MEYKKLIYSKGKGLELQKFNNKQELKENLVEVKVLYSGINYKDALGVTGKAPIFKVDPIVPGIDFVGLALNGKHQGKRVMGQGTGFGENLDGGYTELALVKEDLLVLLPETLSAKESMILGTAGFTAALALYRMETNGQTPEKGPILISGATGGVGGFAIQIFKKKGYEVHALTHRVEYKEYLTRLGADVVIEYKKEFNDEAKIKPLEKAKWAGVVDNLGGKFLEAVIPQVNLWGNVASIGLAKGVEFKSTVMPYILRGVSLLGTSSANCAHSVREKIWHKLGSEWKLENLNQFIEEEVVLDEVLKASQKIIDHKSRGRILVKLGEE